METEPFEFSTFDWPTKRVEAKIISCFGGEGVDAIQIGNIKIREQDFIQIIKDYMTKVPVTVCDTRLRLDCWFKTMTRKFPKGDPFHVFFVGGEWDSELGKKNG